MPLHATGFYLPLLQIYRPITIYYAIFYIFNAKTAQLPAAATIAVACRSPTCPDRYSGYRQRCHGQLPPSRRQHLRGQHQQWGFERSGWKFFINGQQSAKHGSLLLPGLPVTGYPTKRPDTPYRSVADLQRGTGQDRSDRLRHAEKSEPYRIGTNPSAGQCSQHPGHKFGPAYVWTIFRRPAYPGRGTAGL